MLQTHIALKIFLEDIKQTLLPRYAAREAENVAFELLRHFWGITRTDVLLNKALENPVENELLVALAAIQQGVPLQYALSTAYFSDLELFVNHSVLIPRPETEELVCWIHETLAGLPQPTVMDIGTGSGCIALAIKKLIPSANVYGMDVSVTAIAVAKRNAQQNNLAVNFLQGDFLYDDTFEYPKADALISNPPYIPLTEKNLVSESVWRYEPHLALFTTSQDPLIFYRKIAEKATELLKPGGWILVETNENNNEEVVKLFLEAHLKNVEYKKDMQDKKRMVRAQYV